MAHNLRPLRQYNENDVVNLFAFSGNAETTSVVLTKGAVVKVQAPGFNPGTALNSTPNTMLGSVGASYDNTVSERYGVGPKISLATSGSSVLGLTLLDVRELDENGEKLVFNPRKAAEMNVVISGQAVPVLTKGLVLYSGVNATAGHVASVSATAGDLQSTAALPAGGVKVGTWLGTAVNNVALLKIEL
jgi:hypothetical protein